MISGKNKIFLLYGVFFCIAILPSAYDFSGEYYQHPISIADIKKDFESIVMHFSKTNKEEGNIIKIEKTEQQKENKNRPAGQTAYESVLEEDGTSDEDKPLVHDESTVHEEHIFSHLFNLGVQYNKHLTFIMLSLGVVLALFFPQKTKSFVNQTTSRISAFFKKIKEKLFLKEKKYISIIAH